MRVSRRLSLRNSEAESPPIPSPSLKRFLAYTVYKRYTNSMHKVVIAFDIDGTLRNNKYQDTVVANEQTRAGLIWLSKMKNTKIIAWSGGGELYARQCIAALGLSKYVDQYADKMYTEGPDPDKHYFATDIKPDIAIDDIQECILGNVNLIVREK